MEADYHIRGRAPAPPSTMHEPEGQSPSSWKVGYHSQGTVPAPPSTLDEPGGQNQSSGEVGYHIPSMLPAPPLMMELGELSFLEADCRTRSMAPSPPLTMELGEGSSLSEVDYRTRDTAPSPLSMMEPGVGSSPLEVDYHTQDTALSPIVRWSGLRMDSLPPQVGREVPAHARALMANASGVAVVAHEGLASPVEHMAPDTSCLNCPADTGKMVARRVRHSLDAERGTEVVIRDGVPLAYRGMLV